MDQIMQNEHILKDETRDTEEIKSLDEDFIEQIKKEAEKNYPPIPFDPGFSRVVCVDNIPVAPQQKVPVLQKVLLKIFRKVGTIEDGDIFLPLSAEKKTKGFAFLVFKTPDEAAACVSKMNNFVLDKAHTFQVNRLSDFEKYAEKPSEYTPPVLKDLHFDQDLTSWLHDSHFLKGFDQFLIRYGVSYEIFWNNPKTLGKPIPCFGKQNIENMLQDDMYMTWSPLGTYLATFHPQGVALWGGPNFTLINRFPHKKANAIDFSPNESYLVTSCAIASKNIPDSSKVVRFWDIRTGEKMREFPSAMGFEWPAFQWSPGEQFFSKIGKDCISVYETKNHSFTLLGKESLKVKGVTTYQWSPRDNIISCFTPEQGNIPARVMLYELPSKEIVRQKNLFGVGDNCKMKWQKNGDYLCVKVDRFSKKKTKKLSNPGSNKSNLEIFRMNEKDIPIELLEFKGNIISFGFEPNSNRFAIIHTDQMGSKHNDISFYKIGDKKLSLLKTVEKRIANSLHWSPQGGFIVFAMIQSGNASNGTLEFFNVDEMETLGSDEHFHCTSVHWDNTGRYLCSSVSQFRSPNIETGYNLYSFQGTLVSHVLKDRFYQFLWRPRPKSLLPPEKITEIKKNLKAYSDIYRQEEKEDYQAIKTKYTEQRRKEKTDWEAYYSERLQDYQVMKDKINKLRGYDSEDETNYVEVEKEINEILEIREVDPEADE